MRKIVVASDSFKGTYSSVQVGEKVKGVLPEDKYNVECIACSDGGEGFCRCLTDSVGGRYRKISVHNPLGRIVEAEYGIIEGDTAVIEMAQASGLMLLSPDEYDPWNASSYGTGELIADAVRSGFRKIIVGLGGSATSDCGTGLLDALCGIRELDECEFVIASDVTNPLCGPNGAAYVFAPQKGADEEMIRKIEERTLKQGLLLEKRSGKHIIDVPGAGAAGGVGAALLSMKNVRICSGVDLVLDYQRFERRIADADLVITGEGCIDSQTLCGKAPYRVAKRAEALGIPCIALYGRLELDLKNLDIPWRKFVQIETVTEKSLALD